MSTPAKTIVRDEIGKIVVAIYRHFDGYPSSHGADLKDFLQDMRIVNGLGSEKKNIANGMDCLAAQLVAHLKKGPGGIYLIGSRREYDWLYEISYNGEDTVNQMSLSVKRFGAKQFLYQGSIKGFDPSIDG